MLCQKYSLSLVWRPSFITSHLRSSLLCETFSSDRQTDGGAGDKKGVRKWNPLATKKLTNERLHNSLPLSQQTQLIDTKQYLPTHIQDSKGNENYRTRGININEYFSERPTQQHIVDKFID